MPGRLVGNIRVRVLLKRRDEDVGVKSRLGPGEQGREPSQRHALLHRVAVELSNFGMCAQVAGFAVLPDVGTASCRAEIWIGFASFGLAKWRARRACLRKVGQVGVFLCEEFGWPKIWFCFRVSCYLPRDEMKVSDIRLPRLVRSCAHALCMKA